ncbi:hypothetical protein MQ089_09740 [Edwardsiella anguillarum]|uniref:hypothetical protein n=1 Tax=Edwardsiella anguillarum TaxID=1821960 RepID=UPI0024B6BA33|nr:hypothetical protein [Edwardsiella anguillarum]WHP82074.1 hypothetical protein MQ090_09720 [Edwardsiella anguillarum]WHQ19608.1 hypothetical protein MQ085_09750 [Edwardsiella anguillarum]WHQ23141.1 hypothetical protein MQ089_09740 [Edwardsiella anguillarum]WHQ26671.1 hypothetical protein MQ094_09755 [Edwardsiella anguillarum]WHQ30193.1 hypothetical protein MQ093_09970 [Edwardsiella anguillarum]
MSYSLKYLPEYHPRPEPIKKARWFMTLCIILALSIILMRIFGRYVDNHHFWLFALGVPTAIWGSAFAFRLGTWMLRDIKANGFDRRREQWILRETRSARRALQVLNVSFITGHSASSQEVIAISMQDNDSIIVSQTDRNGNASTRMSRVASSPQDTPKYLITGIFSRLLAKLPFIQFPDKASLVVVFNISTSLPQEDIRHCWDDAMKKNNITVPVEYGEGNGLSIIDDWLNTRIKDKAMLLIVGLQFNPSDSDNTAEAGVAILLGNRLTQEALEPVALLHRPDPAPPGGLEEGMRMAAYNVPIKENIVKHLWLAGLTKEQRAEVVESQNKHPAQSVEDDAVANLDVSMGHAGAAAPWLAIAAATEIARQTQLPQMIISGDTTQDVLWSTLVTPIASRQEMDA